MKNRKLSIIVPCYNEEETVDIFYSEILKVLGDMKNPYEIIFVNDGSKDNTLDRIKTLAKKNKRIKYISFSRNFGKESAMYAGLCNSNGGGYICFIDADLQHPPIYIKEMSRVLDKGKYDCVALKRINRTGDSKIKTIFSHLFYKLINLFSYVQMQDGAGDYRMMTRDYADSLISLKEHSRFSKGLFGYIGYDTYWIEYENVDRVAGQSSWKITNLIRYAFDGIVSFSDLLLDIMIYIGIIVFGFGIFYFAIRTINSKVNVQTNNVIYLLFGIVMIMISILAQYIKKIFTEVSGRPHYIIKESNISNIKKVN